MPRPQMDCHAAPGRSTDAPRRPKSKASHDISTPAPQRLFEPWCSGRSAVVEFGPRPPICSRFLSLRSGRQRRLRAAPRCSTRRLRCLRRASTPCAAARFHGGVLGTTRTDTRRRRSAATTARLCLPRFVRCRGFLIGTHRLVLPCASSMPLHLYGRRELVMDACERRAGRLRGGRASFRALARL
jgi:hypothetical protein